MPVRGGAITFSKADILLKPENGTAVFFAYKGPDGNMDEGVTEHSSCPVIEGEKWATTAWMRLGVSEDEPWTEFDPMGLPILDTAAMASEDDVSEESEVGNKRLLSEVTEMMEVEVTN